MKILNNTFSQVGNEVQKLNEKDIDLFNKLPFWKKWFKKENLGEKIINRWKTHQEFIKSEYVDQK